MEEVVQIWEWAQESAEDAGVRFLALAALRFAARAGGDFGMEIRAPIRTAEAHFGPLPEADVLPALRTLWWHARRMGDEQEKPVFVGMRRDEDGALLLELHAEWIDWRMRELADAGAIDALTTAERALFEDVLEAQGAYQTALMESAGLLDGGDAAQEGGIAGLRR